MQRFRFRLERVLEWRRKKCRLEESRLAVCLGLVHATERQIEHLRAERASIDQELLERTAIPAADFLNLGCYRVRARQEGIELAKELEQRVQSASEQGARVQLAQQGVKLLEKMRERQIEEHTLLAGRELEQVAAEAYLAGWPRAHRAHGRRASGGAGFPSGSAASGPPLPPPGRQASCQPESGPSGI